jgi:ribosomal subunit interface protein
MELSPAQSGKLTAEFEKVGKMLDNGVGEAHAHVVLSHERFINNVEITVPYHHHELVGHGSHEDLFSAVHAAIDKLEAQAVKARSKWRDSKRVPRNEESGADAGEAPAFTGEPIEGTEATSGEKPR